MIALILQLWWVTNRMNSHEFRHHNCKIGGIVSASGRAALTT